MDVVAHIGITLDGVMQAPARPDEDRRGGFEHGGWGRAYADPDQGRKVSQQSQAETGGLLLGRRTYQDFFAIWPGRTDSPFCEVLNRRRKYVASRTLREPLPWVNSTLLPGDAADAVAELREQPGDDLVVLGSGELLRSLIRRGLVDRYVLTIHPLVLGSGRRLFDDAVPRASLELVEATTTPTGVVVATYRPLGTRARSAA